MISVGALAVGYLLLSLFSASANLSGDVCTTLFGSASILTLTKTEVWLCTGLSIAVVIIFVLFYNKIFAVTFDEDFARASGTRAEAYNLLIAVVIAVIIVLAMNLVGSLLISALIIFPAMSAMRLFRSFKGVTVCSAVLSVVCAFLGIIISILAGTPVVAGGLDAAAGTLGVGVTEDGETQEQAGQAGGMSICLGHYAAHPLLILSPHVVPGRWLLQGGTTGGSGAYRWFREQCCPELSYEEMDALAARSEPLSGGLVFLPYMAGERSPLWRSEAKGVFYGLSFAATRGDMLRAVMEGTAYALRHNLDTAREAGCAVTALRSSGGGAASELWTAIKANVTGCDIYAERASQATVRGAALLAGMGVGAVKAWNAWKTPGTGRHFTPDARLKEQYDRGYARYRQLIDVMMPVYLERSH